MTSRRNNLAKSHAGLGAEGEAAIPDVIPLRRAWRSLIPSLAPAMLVGVAGYGLSSHSDFFYAPITIPISGTSHVVQLPIFLLFFLFLLIRPLMLRFDSYSEIRAHHIVAAHGLLSFRRGQTSIPYEDIRGVKVTQGIWDRIVGCGDLICWSVEAQAPELRVKGLAHVYEHAEIVKDRIDLVRIYRARH